MMKGSLKILLLTGWLYLTGYIISMMIANGFTL